MNADRFAEALTYAAVLHGAQERKGSGIPYISHLLATAALALEHGADEDEAVAALLHDAAEDHGGRARVDDIRVRFGDRVARIVEGCTDTFDSPKPEWRLRKERHIEELKEAEADVRLVSACDKLHNAGSILRDYRAHGEDLWARFRGGRESLWYYNALREAFRGRIPGPLFEELDRTVTALLAEAGWRSDEAVATHGADRP